MGEEKQVKRFIKSGYAGEGIIEVTPSVAESMKHAESPHWGQTIFVLESDYDALTLQRDALKGALELWLKFFDDMPKGQFANVVCDIGLMNEAFMASHDALKACGKYDAALSSGGVG